MRQLPQKIEDSRAISATLDTGVAASSGPGVGVCIARRRGAGYWKHIHCLQYDRMFTVPVLTTEMLSPLERASSRILLQKKFKNLKQTVSSQILQNHSTFILSGLVA